MQRVYTPPDAVARFLTLVLIFFLPPNPSLPPSLPSLLALPSPQAFNYQLWGQSQYLSPADIGALLYSMAYIKARPNPNQLQRLLDNITSRSDRAGGDDFANVVLALAQFNYTPT